MKKDGNIHFYYNEACSVTSLNTSYDSYEINMTSSTVNYIVFSWVIALLLIICANFTRSNNDREASYNKVIKYDNLKTWAINHNQKKRRSKNAQNSS